MNLRNIVNKRIAEIKSVKPTGMDNNLKPMQKVAQSISHNINKPTNPLCCNGSSYQCNIVGTGTMPIKNINMGAVGYDKLASNMQEGGMIGKSFENNTILNCRQNSICTNFTNKSLKDSFAFENFQ